MFVQFSNLQKSWRFERNFFFWYHMDCNKFFFFDIIFYVSILLFKILLPPINLHRFLLLLETIIGLSWKIFLWLGLIWSKYQCLLTISYILIWGLLNVDRGGLLVFDNTVRFTFEKWFFFHGEQSFKLSIEELILITYKYLLLVLLDA